MSTEADDSDDDDSSHPSTDKLNSLSLGTEPNGNENSNSNTGLAANGRVSQDESKTEADGASAFDVSALKGKAKRPAAGGKPRKAPDSKAKIEKAEKAAKSKKEGKQKVRPSTPSAAVQADPVTSAGFHLNWVRFFAHKHVDVRG